MVGLIALLAHLMGPAFLVIAIPILIFSPNKCRSVIIGFFGIGLMLCGWMPAIFVAYHYNLGFILGAVLVVATFIVGSKIADHYL